MDEVSGSVDYDLEGSLPTGSQLVVELWDTTLTNAPRVLISRDSFEIDGPAPHAFRLDYNPRSVGEKNAYVLEARIETADERPLFDTETAYSVITRGHPSRVNMDLSPTDLAERLVTNDEPVGDQTKPDEGESGLIETIMVDDPLSTVDNPPVAAGGGGGGVAFFLILVVAIGFVVVLVARHRATRPTDEDDEDDFIDNEQA